MPCYNEVRKPKGVNTMFFRILKKDLQRRKATNAILLVFILLASMFFSSSVNNAMAVLGGIDSFSEKAHAPNLLAASLQNEAVAELLAGLKSVDSCDVVSAVVLDTDQLTHNGKAVESFSPYLIPFAEQKLTYFDENNEPITEVAPGTVRVSATSMRQAGLSTGDILEFEIGDEIRKLTIAGPLKDATCLGRLYMMNPEDHDAWFSGSDELDLTFFYIYTNDRSDATEQLTIAFPSLMIYEIETLHLNLLPEMILAGILLAVSICLMLIAFVVLRFTISFTLTEEFRQIGVMKAIGLPNPQIRRLYLAKYLLLAVVGAFIGFLGSIPFSNLLLDSVSQTMVLGSEDSLLINALCCILVVVIILAFCYSCTAKVKKFTPVDAIRSGTTGERFQKKGLLRLSKTPGKPTFFLALNDVLSQPRRFGAIILTLFLCLSLVLMLTTSVNTLKSSGLVPAFDMTRFHLACGAGYDFHPTPDGNQLMREELKETEALLKQRGMDCRCYTEVDLTLSLLYKDNKHSTFVSQGIGTTTDQYTYFEGSAPCRTGEIALTKIVADKLEAGIGDTVTMQIGKENREFLVTGFYQTIMNTGNSARVHEDESISYEYLTSTWAMQIEFPDDPSEAEIRSRGERIKEILDIDIVETEAEFVDSMIGMSQTLESVRLLILTISLIIIVLIVVLIGQSFIAKERADIAILKAVGFRNSQIISWQALRFVIICVIATILALVFHMPLMNLAITPIFTGMGAAFGIQYEINALEIYCIYPALFLGATCISAFLTAQYTRTVQTNECSNID